LEVYDKNQWVAYETLQGKRGIPEDYLSWWEGLEPLVQALGANNLQVT